MWRMPVGWMPERMRIVNGSDSSRGSATRSAMTNGNDSPIAAGPRRIRRVQRKVAIFSIIFFASWLTDVFAQGPAPSPLLSPAPAPVLPAAPPLPELTLAHELTKPDLEAFLDALIPAQFQNRDMAGAVISVVKDGQVLLAK